MKRIKSTEEIVEESKRQIRISRELFCTFIVVLFILAWSVDARAKELDGRQRFVVDYSCSHMEAAIQQVAAEFTDISVQFVGSSSLSVTRPSLSRNFSNEVYCGQSAVQFAISIPEGMMFEDSHEYSDDHTVLATTRTWWYVEAPNRIVEFDIWFSLIIAPDMYYGIAWHEFAHATGEPHSDYWLDLMYFAPLVSHPSIEDIQRVTSHYGRCDKSYRTDRYRDILIPSMDVEGEDSQVIFEHIGGADFRAVSVQGSVCR